ncbi:MAG: hypothetical protein P8X82_15305 [Gemmatimonadales bacterium]
MTSGTQSEVGAIGRLVMKHAKDAFIDDYLIDSQWSDLNYLGRPDLERAITESPPSKVPSPIMDPTIENSITDV